MMKPLSARCASLPSRGAGAQENARSRDCRQARSEAILRLDRLCLADLGRAAAHGCRAAIAAALLVMSPAAAASASFTLADGATVNGKVAAFGARYIVVAGAEGGFFVIDRARLASVSVMSNGRRFEGRLADYDKTGFLIESGSGPVRVQETAAPALPASKEPPTDGPSPAAPAAEAPTASKMAAAVAVPSDKKTPPPLEDAPASAPAPAERSSEPAALADKAAAVTDDAGAPPKTETAAAAAKTAERRPPTALVIPTDSPATDRRPDEFKIQTVAPAPKTAPNDAMSSPKRETSSTRSPSKPAAPAVRVPKMATPQLSVAARAPEPRATTADEAASVARATRVALAPAERKKAPVAAAPGEKTSQLAPKVGRPSKPGAAPTPDAGPARPPVPKIGGSPTAPAESAAPDADRAPAEEVSKSPATPGAAPHTALDGKSPALESPAADPSPAPAASAAPATSGDAEKIAPAAPAIPKMDKAPTPSVTEPDRKSGATPPATEKAVAADAPPSGEASPLEDRIVAKDAKKAETPGAVAAVASPTTPAKAKLAQADAADRRALTIADAPATPEVTRELGKGPLYEEYRMGILGPPLGQEGRISCARLGGVDSVAKLGKLRRADPNSLIVHIGPDTAEKLVQWTSGVFLSAPSSSLPRLAPRTDPVAFSIAPSAGRLTLPARVVGLRLKDGQTPFTDKQADIAIIGGAPPAGAFEAGRARLIGFDALAIIAHPDAIQGPLSALELGGFLSGKFRDWSMVDPRKVGDATFLLPVDGAPSLKRLLEFSGAHRARPKKSRRISGALGRAAAVKSVKGALALTLWSALGESKALEIGARGAGVTPSLDTIRSASYPLVWPIYAVLPEETSHGSAIVLFEFLSSPAGQRAIYDSGLAPVAACDPSTCNLTALGLTDARERIAAPPRLPALQVEPPAAVSAPRLTSFAAPVSRAAAMEAFVSRLAAFIASVEPSSPISATPLQIVARSGPTPGLSASAAKRLREIALVRAEAAALALRCSGLRVESVRLDPTPRAATPDGGASISIDVLEKK
ncbi:MAG: hypothetical protein MRY74_08775 [Neomegalonema sp.]|nr:hypothetical protein [Neomegalonema sp.]